MALLPITNPFSTAPMFLAITEGDSDADRARQANMGVLYMFLILFTFLIAGTLIMNFFGISIPGLRIAGGIMIARIAMKMLQPKKEDEQTDEEQKESRGKNDVSFSPLAMPSLSGPGSIAATIGLTSLVKNWFDYVAIALGILGVCLLCWAVLRGATRITRVLGVNGMHALTKIMGFLLLCVGIQFIVNGILGVLTDEKFISTIVATIKGL